MSDLWDKIILALLCLGAIYCGYILGLLIFE